MSDAAERRDNGGTDVECDLARRSLCRALGAGGRSWHRHGYGAPRPRLLSRAEAAELAYSPALAHLSRGERLSFRKADILIEAADESGEPCYVAVEASYTADERDTERALRNAELLRRATGRPARAAVAYVRADDRVRPAVESGDVHLHELPDHRDSADFE